MADLNLEPLAEAGRRPGLPLDPEALEAACRLFWERSELSSYWGVSWDWLAERGDHKIPGWREALEAGIVAYIEAEGAGTLATWRERTSAISKTFAESMERLEGLSAAVVRLCMTEDLGEHCANLQPCETCEARPCLPAEGVDRER